MSSTCLVIVSRLLRSSLLSSSIPASPRLLSSVPMTSSPAKPCTPSSLSSRKHPLKHLARCGITDKPRSEFKYDPANESGLIKELVQQVRKVIGPFASPKKIYVVSDLPKTRSGKIMRRIMRKVIAGEGDQLGDLSTLAEPAVVDVIKNKVAEVLGA